MTEYSLMLAPGRPVSLLGPNRGSAHPGTVRSWDVGEAGLVVTSTIAVDDAALDDLAGRRVWLSTLPSTEDEEGVTVFAAVAQASRAGELSLTGVAHMVQDARRKAARALESRPVALETTAHIRSNLRTIDLSRGGVRVATTPDVHLVAGEHVHVDLILDDGATVPAEGEVTRVYEATGEAVVCFVDVAADDADRIDRHVLSRIARRDGSPDPEALEEPV